MAKSLEFGKSVLVMDADDSKLEAALKADEQLVTQSVNKMQGSLNKLEVSMQGTGSAAGVATSGVSALGAAASATGSQTLMLGSQIGNLGVGLSLMGKQVTTASAQLRIMVQGALAFIATPIGAAVAAIAATLAVVALAWKSAGDEAEKAREKMERIREVEQKRWEAQNKLNAEMNRVQRQVLVAQGQMTQREADFIKLKRELVSREGITIAQIEERLGLESALQDALARKVALAEQERTALAETDRKNKEILATEQERLRIAEALASAAEAEARALTARAGPQTPEQARTMIREQLELENARQRGIFMLLKAQEIARPGGERAGAIEELLRRFGFGGGGAGAKPTTRFGQGAIELSAFAATGRGGGGGAAGPDPIQAVRIAKEDKRTKAAEATARNTERLAEAFGRWKPGAG